MRAEDVPYQSRIIFRLVFETNFCPRIARIGFEENSADFFPMYPIIEEPSRLRRLRIACLITSFFIALNDRTVLGTWLRAGKNSFFARLMKWKE